MKTCATVVALLLVAACGETEGALASNADAGGCGGKITFKLAVDSSQRVYYGGGQPPWPSQDTCPGWLTLDHGNHALILEKDNCDHSCPASQPQAAATQSLTWDGTYYTDGSAADATDSFLMQCDTAVCAAAGTYTATLCVAAVLEEGAGDASFQMEANPTCKTVSFAWPPSSQDQVISVSITPQT